MTTVQPDPRRWYALGLLCTAAFMAILDSQIVILALPSIERGLGFSPGAVQWVLSGYLLSLGGLLLLGGRAADLLGRRRTFMAGTALFVLSSLACGLAWSAGVLVAARVLQGVSAAIMGPTAMSILTTTFPEGPERNKALGFWTGISGVGATAALLIGGPITDALGWRWVFFINLPVGLAMLALSPVLLGESRDRRRVRAYDPAGAVTITAALVLLVYAVTEAPEAGWTGARTVGLLAAAAVLVALFARIEARSPAPLVPLGIFRSRTLVGGNLLVLTLGMAAFGVSFTVSLYAQQVLGFSALRFGVGSAVLTVMAVVGSFTGQGIVTRIGFRPVAWVSMVLIGIGCLLLTQVSVNGSYFGDIFFGLLVFGPGLGAGSTAGSIAALAGVAERESGLASGLSNASFQIGGALGIAVLSTVAVSRTSHLLAGAQRAQPLLALTEGFRSAFAVAIVFAVLGLLVAVLVLRRRSRQGASARARAISSSSQ
jgi:EmrB/QacA subfamily drug resistance transporter